MVCSGAAPTAQAMFHLTMYDRLGMNGELGKMYDMHSLLD
jgi:hypothetical protein